MSLPDTSATAPARTAAPALACDAHIHVIDPAFPPAVPGTTLAGRSTATDYLLTRSHFGTTRTVIVQAKVFGIDNRCLLDAIERLEPARGIAVVHPDISDEELARLGRGGVRGVRFSVWNPADAVASIDMIAPLAPRLAERGWHAQIHMSGDQIAAHAALIDALPCDVVIDHMGRLPPAAATAHPAFAAIRRLIDRGRTWVKLSGAYLDTTVGPPAYPDATEVARALVAAAPERLVWGSDWPHVTEKHKPDTAALFDLLADWAGGERRRRRILVDNPARLYGFE
jgi:predicted TIM-barrel fold metal-dependent hydrolase